MGLCHFRLHVCVRPREDQALADCDFAAGTEKAAAAMADGFSQHDFDAANIGSFAIRNVRLCVERAAMTRLSLRTRRCRGAQMLSKTQKLIVWLINTAACAAFEEVVARSGLRQYRSGTSSTHPWFHFLEEMVQTLRGDFPRIGLAKMLQRNGGRGPWAALKQVVCLGFDLCPSGTSPSEAFKGICTATVRERHEMRKRSQQLQGSVWLQYEKCRCARG